MENYSLTAKYELSDGTKVLTTCHRVQVTTLGFRIDHGHYQDTYRGRPLEGASDTEEVLAKAIKVWDQSGEIRLQGQWDWPVLAQVPGSFTPDRSKK